MTVGLKKVILFLGVIVQVCVCIIFGNLKKTFFCDETYSYGLANSENYTFISNITSKTYSNNNGWVDSSYFKNYVQVSSSTPFSFKAAIVNQENDVHPPLYYMLLHIICSVFSDNFSKWTGIGLNLVILVLIDLVFYYIAKFLYNGNKVKSVLAVTLWSLSSAGLSNILFIRMYLLLTLEIMAYVALHIWIGRKGKLTIPAYILVYLSVIVGGLTHYYFYPFVFFFSAPICVYLLFSKKFRQLICYAGALCLGFVSNLKIFPATINHIFGGYRGTEVTNNLKNRTENVFKEYYGLCIDRTIFAGMFKIFVIVFVIVIIYRMFKYVLKISLEEKSSDGFVIRFAKRENALGKTLDIKVNKRNVLYILIAFAITAFAYIAIVGSQLKGNRYIYPIYPFIAIWIISFLYWVVGTFTKKAIINNIVASIVVVLLCFNSVKNYGVEYMYFDFDSIEEKAAVTKGYDCLLYYGDEWLDVYTALPLKFDYDETFFFNDGDIDNLDTILAQRNSYDNLVVCLPDSYSEEEASTMLGRILEKTSYTGYEYIYHFYTQAYLLK